MCDGSNGDYEKGQDEVPESPLQGVSEVLNVYALVRYHCRKFKLFDRHACSNCSITSFVRDVQDVRRFSRQLSAVSFQLLKDPDACNFRTNGGLRKTKCVDKSLSERSPNKFSGFRKLFT